MAVIRVGWQHRYVRHLVALATHPVRAPSRTAVASAAAYHAPLIRRDVVMNRTHPLARLDPPLASADLAGHAWVTSPPGSVCHQWFRRLSADVPEDPDAGGG
jgi:hypothetical protein